MSEPSFESFVRSYPRTVYEELIDSAMTLPNDRIGWIMPDDGPNGELVIQANEEMYSGQMGIALLCAALYKAYGDSKYEQTARQILEPLAGSDELNLKQDAQIGGVDGYGSWIYVFTKAGTLLNEPDYHEEAARLATFITDHEMEHDSRHDVVNGLAGALLALLSLYDATGTDRVLERAECCGEHLLSDRTLASEGNHAWRAHHDYPVTGLAHGAAGIAYALLRLANETGDHRFTEAALEAVEFENSAYSKSQLNWPTALVEEEKTYLDRWCYGRTGIGLSRLHAYDCVDDERLETDARQAADHVETELNNADHVCCGTFGRVAFLLQAHRRLEDDYRSNALDLVRRAFDRRREDGSFYLPNRRYKRLYAPSLFNGTAGIGYILLRLNHPDSLPAMTVLE